VRLLLDAGVDPNTAYANDLTALMWAAGYGHNEVATVLLNAGARTDPRDNRGKTATVIAEEAGFKETAALLRERETSR
jgi:ankyrin repeat protein